MDKRWIYVIIIFIVGFTALYYVVDSSSTVGSAIVSVNTHLITVPDSFNIESSEYNYALLVNRQTKEHIFMKDLGKGNLIDKYFIEEMDNLVSNENITKINDTTEKYGKYNFTVINYENIDNKTNKIIFFMESGHTFKIKSTDFHDEKTLNEKTNYIIDTFKPDHKKAQD